MKKQAFTHTMRVSFEAKLIPNGSHDSSQVVLEFSGVQPISLDGMQNVKMYNPEDGTKRDFTDDETRDFEDAIQVFVDTRMARSLKKFIRYTEPGTKEARPWEDGEEVVR